MHMQISFKDNGTATVEIDGEDVTRHILADGFYIDLAEGPVGHRPLVHLTLRPTSLTVDGEIQDAPEFALELAKRTEVSA